MLRYWIFQYYKKDPQNLGAVFLFNQKSCPLVELSVQEKTHEISKWSRLPEVYFQVLIYKGVENIYSKNARWIIVRSYT